MKCPKCQFENREGAKFCKECGNKLELICSECGNTYTPDTKFCDECGQILQETAELPSVDYSEPRSYTPRHLTEKILTTRSAVEGERKLVTVFFADVANYTSLSEKLDPEEVHQIMDGFFQILMDKIHKHEGSINQFTGDGVMALFGAPIAHEDHERRACHAALSIQKTMGEYGEKIKKESGVDFHIRMGLNSGPVVVGSIGDDLRMDYTAVGDTTNLAARMESEAAPGAILVSDNTHKMTESYFEFKPTGKTKIKGKEESQKVYELLKASDVVTRFDSSVAKGLSRFVGRKNSMAALMNAYDKAKSGKGQIVGIVGEAGVGKSRLLRELRNHLDKDEIKYLEGQCLQYGGTIIYMPILDILRSFFNINHDDREYIIMKKIKETILTYNENFEHTIPAFHDILSLQVDNEDFLKLEPSQKRERTFDAIRDLLISVSREKPLVLVVEDLHWIDDTSQAFIDYLVEWIPNTSVMMILLYRTEYRHQWGSKTYYHKIGLDHLGPESSAELVKVMLEDGDVVPELKELILDRAAGNPLFMEELTHTLIENGSITKENNQYILSLKSSNIQVPDTVQGIIASRMDRLDDNIKRTMQVASVIGRDFALRILQAITDMHEELKSHLLKLQGLEFIYEKNLFPELEYIFKHALTQEVAYNSVLVKRRKQIHENIGKAIEELYAERLEEFYEMLAYHYSKSNNYEKAYQHLKLSAEKSQNNYANEEAYNYYKEAIEVLKKLPETDENKRAQIDIHISIFNPMMLIGFPPGSLELLQKGASISKEMGDRINLGISYSNISHYYALKGKSLEGIKYAEPLFHEAQKSKDIDLMAPLSVGLCLSYDASGRHYKMKDVIFDVIASLEKTKRESESFGLLANISAVRLRYS